MQVSRQSSNATIRSANLPTHRGARVELPPKLQNEEAVSTWKTAIEAPESMIALDLFCGAGGLSCGFEQAGFVIAAGLDHDRDSCETHAANFLSKTRVLELEKVDDPQALMDELGIPRIDVIIGGPPCQGFAAVGRGKVLSLSREIQERINARNYLYRAFVRFVERLQPLFFVMENVPHMSSFADGIIAQSITRDFEELGYKLYPSENMDATAYGVPQTRRRLFIIGSRIGWVYRRPRPTHGIIRPFRTLADAISDLPPVQAPSLHEKLTYTGYEHPDLKVCGEYATLMRSSLPSSLRDVIFDHIVRPVRDDDALIFRNMKPGDRYSDVDERYRRYEMKRSKRDGRYAFNDRYFKLAWDRPCGTITAHISKDGYRYIYPDIDQPRTLSLREAARVQSFPDHFRFAGFRTSAFRQIGNAVPPLLGEAIADSLSRAIRQYREGTLEEHPWQPLLPGLNLKSI